MPEDDECEFFSQEEPNIIAFAGQNNCMCIFYPCNINVGDNHRSVEYAFQCVEAVSIGNYPKAMAIQSAKLALDAKKLGNPSLLPLVLQPTKLQLY